MPTGTLEYPGRFRDEDTLKRIRSDWKSLHEGLDNVGRVAIPEEGMKFNPIVVQQPRLAVA